MTPTEKTLDKIRKLMAKANDDGVTREEAAAFAAKAAELAARESIELSDVDWTERQNQQPIGAYHFYPEEHDLKRSKRRVAWQEQICHAVCKSQQCQMLLMGGNTFDIIGRRMNIEIAAYLCSYLARFAMRMSEYDYGVCYRRSEAEGDVTQARGFRQAWLKGFATTVTRRLREQREELNLAYASSTALVRLTDEAQAAGEWMRANRSTRQASVVRGSRSSHGEGYAAGSSAGKGVDVTGRATNAGGTAAGRLTS